MVILGIIGGTIMGLIKGDEGSLDYGSYRVIFGLYGVYENYIGECRDMGIHRFI